MTPAIPSRLIEKKRRGEELEGAEIRGFFQDYLEGRVPDYQMAAFLMAVHFRGMGEAELDVLLDEMIHSGAVLDLSHLPGPVVDKHSTGGVGDKTSLVLAPLAAEFGLFVPMMSGRGLGHTAGTLDKLDAIPGFRTDLPLNEFLATLEEVGVAMMGQSESIAPLDRRLYALRDATATVPSIPLISASILSKKVAEGLDGLVLDVKTGSGSFLSEEEDSLALAETMVHLGERRGIRTAALLTGMDAPLGRAVGNGMETREALLCLQGAGPPDLVDLTTALVGEMLLAGGLAPSAAEGARRAMEALKEGRAAERMARMVERQGGDPGVVDEPDGLERAPEVGEVGAPVAGHIHRIAPVPLGYGVVELGGGRRTMDDDVDLRVGFLLEVRVGDRVEVGEPIGEVHAADAGGLARGKEILEGAVEIREDAPPPSPPLVRQRIPMSA